MNIDRQQHVDWNQWLAWRRSNEPTMWWDMQTTADPYLRWLWIHNYPFGSKHHSQWFLFLDRE